MIANLVVLYCVGVLSFRIPIVGCSTSPAIKLNATGGTFPANVYQEAIFSYKFTKAESSISYTGAGSTTGKCNIMGYWHKGDVGDGATAAVKSRDTLICTDACTGSNVATCGFDSSTNPRKDASRRHPLIDFAGSDSLLSTADYKAFPDLQMFPALAGAVVPIYNIPELSGSPGRLILSRLSLAKIFKGDIVHWNDSSILSDNKGNAEIFNVLSNLSAKIETVVRTDSSGTSEILTTALALFDPSGVSIPDYSFAATVGIRNTGNTNPRWCGALTDEIHTYTLSGCKASTNEKVYLRVVDPWYNIRDVSFYCNATAADVVAAFNDTDGGNGPQIAVLARRSSTASSITLTVGYVDPILGYTNTYKPVLRSAPAGVNVSIATLQEGGYFNSHFNSSAYFITTLTQSIFVLKSARPLTFQLTWQDSSGDLANDTFTATSNSSVLRLSLTKSTIIPSISSVKYYAHGSALWEEYRVSFSSSVKKNGGHIAGAIVTSNHTLDDDDLVMVSTLLDPENYPLYYDSRHARGFSGSGRYTCYLRQHDFEAWSYYTGYGNTGVVAEVATRDYSIGYSVLEDIMSEDSLRIARMINQAGAVVTASADSVSYAVMDKGGNLDEHMTVVLSNGYSKKSWPICGFTYYIIRKESQLGSCSRRSAAMDYLYSFYFSDTVKAIAKRRGFASLPDFIRDNIVTVLINTVKCTDTGDYALAKYRQVYTSFMGPTAFETTTMTYMSAFKEIDSAVTWNSSFHDNSLSVWKRYISKPKSTSGVFTMFADRDEKISYFGAAATEGAFITSAFAHIAVVPLYHLNAFKTKAAFPLRMTKDILAGIFSGEIAYWNDSKIQKANAESKKYLPYQKINVVVRDAASDTTGILLSYLTNTSSDFKAVFQHFKSMGDAGYRNMDFGSLIASDRLFFASSNERVDSMVTAVDGTLGYYLQNSAPNAFVAAFCSNSSCAAGGITYPGYDSGASLTACEARSAPVAVFDVAHDIRTYDLKHSKAKGCYPIAGTVDYTVYKKDLTGSSTLCSLSSNRTEHQRIVTEGLRFGSWLYNGSDVVSGLTSAAMVSTSVSHREITYSTMCRVPCGSKLFGYTYCGYRDCSYSAGDYIQRATDCLSGLQMRRVTYELIAANYSCFENNAALVPPKETLVECSYVLPSSAAGIIGYFFVAFGTAVSGSALGFVYHYRNLAAIRCSQTIFIYIFLVGCIMMSLSITVFVGPNTDFTCMARPWFLNISATTMFAPLLAKLHRVDVLLKAAKRMKKKRISDFKVFMQVMAVIAVDVVLLVLWSIINTPRAVNEKRTFLGVYEPVDETVCSTDGYDNFNCVMLTWKSIQLAFGMWKAFQLRNAPPEYAESKQFAVVIYNIAALGGATYFLSVYGAPSTVIFVILRCLGIFAAATVSVFLLIFSKLMTIVEQGWRAAETSSDQKTPCAGGSSNTGAGQNSKTASAMQGKFAVTDPVDPVLFYPPTSSAVVNRMCVVDDHLLDGLSAVDGPICEQTIDEHLAVNIRRVPLSSRNSRGGAVHRSSFGEYFARKRVAVDGKNSSIAESKQSTSCFPSEQDQGECPMQKTLVSSPTMLLPVGGNDDDSGNELPCANTQTL